MQQIPDGQKKQAKEPNGPNQLVMTPRWPEDEPESWWRKLLIKGNSWIAILHEENFEPKHESQEKEVESALAGQEINKPATIQPIAKPITSQPAMSVILQQAKIEIKEDSMMKEQKQNGEACFNTFTG